MASVTAGIQLQRSKTLEEIEAACRETETPAGEEYYNDAPALTMETMLFPLGFPMRVRTNSAEALRQCRVKWGVFKQEVDMEPIETHIHVVESQSQECPPAPIFRFMENMLLLTDHPDNVFFAQLPSV